LSSLLFISVEVTGYGCGKQKGYKEFVCRIEIAITMLPKIKIEIIVSSEEWEQRTIKAIQEVAFIPTNPKIKKNIQL
jgi:nitrogen regulatory protein PII